MRIAHRPSLRAFAHRAPSRQLTRVYAVAGSDTDEAAPMKAPRKLRSLSKKAAAKTAEPAPEKPAPVAASGLSAEEELEAERKKASLHETMARLNKQYSPNTLMAIDSPAQRINIDRISTGCLTLDIALGGGIPRGRVIEIFGPESCGKSTLAMSIMVQATKQYPTDNVILVDVEHAFDKAYGERIGLKGSNVYISTPQSGDEALATVENVISSGSCSVIVLDSVAALLPQTEIAREAGDPQIGAQAKLMSNHMKRIAGAASAHNVSVIYINQIRMKVGLVFGNPETTSGGMALRFYASQRIDVRRKEVIAGPVKDGPARGIKVRARVIKNKVAPPLGEAIFDLLFDRGVDKTGSMIDAAVAKGVIVKRGAYYYLPEGGVGLAEGEPEKNIGQGREKAMAFLDAEENKELYDKIYNATLAAMNEPEGQTAEETKGDSLSDMQQMG